MRTCVRARAYRVAGMAALLVGVAAAATVVLPRPAGVDVTHPYIVRPGDTVWDLASGYVTPGADVRPVVDAILDANGLRGGALQAGETILVPAPGWGVASG